MKRLFALAALVFAIVPAAAEQMAVHGDYQVHFNAMQTSDLAAEVARAYGIERSKSRGLLTVSVLKRNKLGGTEPVAAKVSATATNLNNQLLKIEPREIKEGPAIYYIGEFRVTPPDTLKFAVLAIPAGGKETYTEFQKQFFR
jgi:hypothetical protein